MMNVEGAYAMNKSYSLLVVDDDTAIVQLLKLYLDQQGFRVLIAGNGLEALALIDKEKVDLILLDIQMPELDGYETCKIIRKKTYVPIIFMSSRRHVEDKIKSLTLGGDDYITKPFDFIELEARIRAQIRSYQLNEKDEMRRIIHLHGLKVDLDKEICFVANERIPLSTTEMNILLTLVKDVNKVWSASELYDAVWGFDTPGDVQTIKVHMSNLRKKLHAAHPSESFIETVRGFGYKINK